MVDMEFTGDNDIGVKDFLNWMESWFAMFGFNGETVESMKMRAGQIRVHCPDQSVAGRFLQTLSDEILWDEDALAEALIAQFDDGEIDSQAQEDILSTMGTFRQGDDDAFSYSRRVLKLLRRKPSGPRRYERIFIRHYIDGLASPRLRTHATVSFLGSNHYESPHQAVKGIMGLATQLEIEGYKKYSGENSDDDDDDDDGNGDSSSDSEAEEDDYYGASRKKRKIKKADKLKRSIRKKRKNKKADKLKRSSRKREKRLMSKERKSPKGQGDEGSVRREAREPREMIHDPKKIQKAAVTPNTGAVATGNDIIPLDSYISADDYEQNLQPIRYPYGQRNTSHPTTRRPEYSNTGSHACYDGGHLKTGRIGPLTRSDVCKPTRRRTDHPRFTRNPSIPPGSNSFSCSYKGNPTSQQIFGPDGALYYPSHSLVCFLCQELGHLYTQCPRLHDPELRTALLGPEHPDTRVALRKEPQAQTYRKSDKVVETALKLSALGGMKVHEETKTEVNPLDLRRFVRNITDDGDGDDEDEEHNYEEDEEEIIYDVVEYYYLRQIAENPEN